jgi:peptide/histidine transporter 3/4
VAKVTTKGGKVGWIPDDLNVGHLDYFFWLIAALSLVKFVVYLLIARWYTYKKTAGDYPDAKGGGDDEHDQ